MFLLESFAILDNSNPEQEIRNSLSSALSYLEHAYCLSRGVYSAIDEKADKFCTDMNELIDLCSEAIDSLDEMKNPVPALVVLSLEKEGFSCIGKWESAFEFNSESSMVISDEVDKWKIILCYLDDETYGLNVDVVWTLTGQWWQIFYEGIHQSDPSNKEQDLVKIKKILDFNKQE